MKIVKKYASMALLLMFTVGIMPLHATTEEVVVDNQEEVVVEAEQVETVWYKRHDVREKIGTALSATTLIAAYAMIAYAVFVKDIWGFKRIQQDPFDIRAMNTDIEVKKMLKNYELELRMTEATAWNLPTTHKADFLAAVKAMYNKYGFSGNGEIYNLVDGNSVLRVIL